MGNFYTRNFNYSTVTKKKTFDKSEKEKSKKKDTGREKASVAMSGLYRAVKRNLSVLIRLFVTVLFFLTMVAIPPVNADVTNWLNEVGMGMVDTFVLSESATVDNSTLRVVRKLNRSCTSRENPECMIKQMNSYVRDNVRYKMTTGLPTYREVLEEGEARCVGQAVVFASLAKSAGFDTYYAYQPRHICVVWRKNGDTGAWNCLDSEELMYTSPVTVSN